RQDSGHVFVVGKADQHVVDPVPAPVRLGERRGGTGPADRRVDQQLAAGDRVPRSTAREPYGAQDLAEAVTGRTAHRGEQAPGGDAAERGVLTVESRRQRDVGELSDHFGGDRRGDLGRLGERQDGVRRLGGDTGLVGGDLRR